MCSTSSVFDCTIMHAHIHSFIFFFPISFYLLSRPSSGTVLFILEIKQQKLSLRFQLRHPHQEYIAFHLHQTEESFHWRTFVTLNPFALSKEIKQTEKFYLHFGRGGFSTKIFFEVIFSRNGRNKHSFFFGSSDMIPLIFCRDIWRKTRNGTLFLQKKILLTAFIVIKHHPCTCLFLSITVRDTKSSSQYSMDTKWYDACWRVWTRPRITSTLSSMWDVCRW